MSFLDLFRRKEPSDRALQLRPVALVKRKLTDRNNRIRAEDAICAAAAIVGERCIDAAGDYPLREHDIIPGQRVFSTKANELLCGDSLETGIEPNSIFGLILARVKPAAYPPAAFPDARSVFTGYAAGIGKTEDWGKVPVTVPPNHQPWIIPLQFGYDTRDEIDSILKPVEADKIRCLRIAVGALVDLLNQMAGAIDPALALLLAFEICNGMAKTAPMTKKAFLTVKNSAPGKPKT